MCLVSILSSTFISREFEEYVKLTQKKQADDLAESIGSHYDESGGGFNIDYVHGMGMYALKDGFLIRLYNKTWNFSVYPRQSLRASRPGFMKKKTIHRLLERKCIYGLTGEKSPR